MLIKKPPIIVVLGHIDHGKTTLLDYIRKSKVALTEAGGITQKIGAYEIEFNGEKLTFIDTPGHAAFNSLRERGVKIADIGILVIAADEGVKDQTRESLIYLKSANLPFVVALNKIDKENANPEKVISQLIELEVIPEKFGGQVPVLEISAKTGQGINDLLETLILLRDIYDLKVEIDKEGSGYILEVFKDPKRGFLASGIITEGKVEYGDFIITLSSFCKIKIFEDDLGQKIDFALPSKPALIGNFEFLPDVGENFVVGRKEEIEKIRKELLTKEETVKRKYIFVSESKEDLEEFQGYLLIIKADHLGSLEALEKIFEKIARENNLNFKIIKADLGQVTFEDIKLAKEFKAILISFNVKNSKQIIEEIKSLNIKFFESNVIYKIEEEFIDFLQGREREEVIRGELEVLATFSQTRTKKTIGGKVVSGKIKLGQKVMIFREGRIVGKGKIISLEKNKISVEEVKEGELCGLIIETSEDIFQGDLIQV
jgi:translation initiation factor IF-2